MGIEDQFLAYQFDTAVGVFGRWVQNKLDERDEKNQPVHRIERLLQIPQKQKPLRETLRNWPGVDIAEPKL